MQSFFCDKKSKLFNVHKWLEFRHDVEVLEFSPDGTFVLLCSYDNIVYKYCLKSGELVQTFKMHCNNCIVFSPDGKYVLGCGHYNDIQILCLESGIVSTFSGQITKCGAKNGQKKTALFKSPRNIVFSPDGSFILVSDNGNDCIRRIDVVSGKVTNFVGKSDTSVFRYKFALRSPMNGCRFLLTEHIY